MLPGRAEFALRADWPRLQLTALPGLSKPLAKFWAVRFTWSLFLLNILNSKLLL